MSLPKIVNPWDYPTDPIGYARDVLGVRLWYGQEKILASLVEHRRLLVESAHGIGKSFVAAVATNWHYDNFDPSVTLTTAPTQDQVDDVLWKEIRTLRAGRPGLMPKTSRMESSPDHFAVGYTAKTDSSFQGRHAANVFIVFDEGTGIDPAFWDGAEGMLTGTGALWLVILNPTDTTSQAYTEAKSGRFHVMSVSALDHPNVYFSLRGEPEPFPGAVSLEWVEGKLDKWCERMPEGDEREDMGDFEFPPESGVWYRPNAEAEARLLGRWPSQGSDAIWTELLWKKTLVPQEPPTFDPAQAHTHLVIGCDVAAFGSDYTSMVVRRGACVLHHETHNGWGSPTTAARLQRLAHRYADKERGENPFKVRIQIDDTGVGNGVICLADGYNFIGIGAAERANEADLYPNRRSELWFVTAERAREGRVDLSRLKPDVLELLRQQAMVPKWKMQQDRRKVEDKDELRKRKRLGRSPDDMDALNLAFATPRMVYVSAGVTTEAGNLRPLVTQSVPTSSMPIANQEKAPAAEVDQDSRIVPARTVRPAESVFGRRGSRTPIC